MTAATLPHFRPLPNHIFVEDYIRAYYLSESDTEDWLRKHQVSVVWLDCHVTDGNDITGIQSKAAADVSTEWGWYSNQ